MKDRFLAKLPDAVFCIVLFLIILFSFLTFSYRFYPLLNADMAINILMTPSYHVPGDLYAWGQDRGGTLIPMLANILYRMVHISPVSAVSVVHYMILIAGFLSTMGLFRSKPARIFLAMAWFFPPWHFTDFLLFPFGTQLSLFMTGVFFLAKSEKSTGLLRKNIWLAISCILLILSVWVSELGIIMVILLCVIKIYPSLAGKQKRSDRNDTISFLINILTWIVLGTLFIMYSKSKATRIDVYSDHPLNNGIEILGSIKIILRSLYKVFIFSSENFIESIYAWMLILGIPVITIHAISGNKGWFRKINREWFLFFLLNGLITFIVVILSHWAFLNGVGRRYFVLVYISLAIVLLLMVETLEKRQRNIAVIILSVMILTGAISSVYKFYYPKHKPPRIKVLSEFQSLGNIGLIAEYWNAYLSATPDPVHIKATPHDKDYVRNLKLAEEVFEQPRIYIIKDDWMDSFPDTLRQFGRTLARQGGKFYIGECWVNQYEIVYPCRKFLPGDLKYQGKLTDDPASKDGKAVMIGPGISFEKTRHFIYGPFISMEPGHYIARFYLRVKKKSSSAELAELDVSSDFGKNVLVSRKLTCSDFNDQDQYQAIDLNVELQHPSEGIEFRIFYTGNAELYFNRVDLFTMKTL
jgi:hypothetical protein